MKKQMKFTSLLKELEKFIRASSSGRRRMPDGRRISDGTIETYQNFQKILIKYSSRYGDVDILTSMRLNKRVFRERCRYWKQRFFQFHDFMIQCRYGESYIWNNEKILKTVLHYLFQQNGWPDTTVFKIKLPRLIHTEPLVLSLGQVRELIRVKFNNSKEMHFELIRDIMVTGCLTALRYSDLVSLTWSDLIERQSKIWLVVRHKKTGTVTRVLLPEFLVKTLNKYRKLRRNNVFPRISNVNLNIQIKKLAKVLGWETLVPMHESKCGVLKATDVFKLCDVITTHTMRRTAITLMLQLGMSENIVRQISGHAPNSKEFYRYIKISQDWQERESERVQQLFI